MDTGKKTIEWLYSEQLQVDAEWSVKSLNGFQWWADKNLQTVEVVGQEGGPGSETDYTISVRTELFRSLNLGHRELAGLNLLMSVASMAGPVYDQHTKTLCLCSLVRVHEGISQWMNPLISLAAVLQIGEARIISPELAKWLTAEEALTAPPGHSMRTEPDDMANMISTLIAPEGRQPSRWLPEEFQEAVDDYMRRPPGLRASAEPEGFTVEFPYGDRSSFCRARADQPHPKYGNGLFILQSFPVARRSDAAGVKLALSMNRIELNEK